jgi:preprotein translocase subunit SecE
MVIIFGTVAAVFFYFVDTLLRLAMNFLLNLGA